MTTSTSRLSFKDCYQVFDEALAGKHGARCIVGSYSKANFFRLRMHQARVIDRKDNMEIYPDPSHGLHGRSLYDQLMLVLKEDVKHNWWIYAIKTELDPARIERLDGDAPIEYIETDYEEVKLLEDQTNDNEA
jgi:hypothetical protein